MNKVKAALWTSAKTGMSWANPCFVCLKGQASHLRDYPSSTIASLVSTILTIAFFDIDLLRTLGSLMGLRSDFLKKASSWVRYRAPPPLCSASQPQTIEGSVPLSPISYHASSVRTPFWIRVTVGLRLLFPEGTLLRLTLYPAQKQLF